VSASLTVRQRIVGVMIVLFRLLLIGLLILLLFVLGFKLRHMYTLLLCRCRIEKDRACDQDGVQYLWWGVVVVRFVSTSPGGLCCFVVPPGGPRGAWPRAPANASHRSSLLRSTLRHIRFECGRRRGGGGSEGCAEEGRRRWLRYLSCRARKDRSPFCIHRVRGGGKMVGVRSAEMGLAHGCGRSAQAQWGPATQKSHERVT
jgi:hypothetical protein